MFWVSWSRRCLGLRGPAPKTVACGRRLLRRHYDRVFLLDDGSSGPRGWRLTSFTFKSYSFVFLAIRGSNRKLFKDRINCHQRQTLKDLKSEIWSNIWYWFVMHLTGRFHRRTIESGTNVAVKFSHTSHTESSVKETLGYVLSGGCGGGDQGWSPTHPLELVLILKTYGECAWRPISPTLKCPRGGGACECPRGACQFFGGRMTSRGQCPRGCAVVTPPPPFRKSCIRVWYYFYARPLTAPSKTRIIKLYPFKISRVFVEQYKLCLWRYV